MLSTRTLAIPWWLTENFK